ncbi:MAG: tRNA pseudouridine(38-40) synthase TruA [Acidimicrobiales bacterium]
MTLFDADADADAEAEAAADAEAAGSPGSGPDPGPPPGPDGPSVCVRMTVAYDGSGFRGFAAQPAVKTVGGHLTSALQRILRHPLRLTCAGRTDAGVHAWGQVVSFRAATERFDPVALQRSLNRMLGPAIVVRAVAAAEDGFDARRSALSRTYRYTVLNREVPDPFLAGVSWHVEAPLDLKALRLACDPLLGEHDFSSFCRAAPAGAGEGGSLVRRVLDARWEALGEDLVRFEVTATSFCQQMVRALVGTAVEMGEGRRRPGEMAAILRAADRARAGNLAPPHGLCLWSVAY